jgi:hypothetical protein
MTGGTRMRLLGRKSLGVVATLALMLLAIFPARADDGEDSVFCAWAQQVAAGTALTANVVTHTVFEDFVKSKASYSPLTVQQYWSNPVAGPDGLAQVVSCKMSTAERINHAHQADAPDAAPVATGDESCDKVHREVLAILLNTIPPEALAVPVDSLRVDKEERTYIGPMWLRPWPFQPLSRDADGLLHIHSRALYVPFAWWIPMPDRFKGAHYCHLIAPDFLEAVLRGEIPAGV